MAFKDEPLCFMQQLVSSVFLHLLCQEIDDLLSGGLTDEDESDVLAELDQIIQVSDTCYSYKIIEIFLF